jgi:hypothetical protein
VGKFDTPGEDCLSDVLVRLNEAGAIAAISSARLAYANSNETFARIFYSYLFDSTLAYSIGAAYGSAMAKATSERTSVKSYALLGDPSILFVNRSHAVALSIRDEKKLPLDTLQALQRITVQGTVNPRGAGLPAGAAFGTANAPAYVQIGIYNPPDTSIRKDGGSWDVSYSLPGAPIFVGTTPVTGGAFELSLVLPRRLSFGKPGAKLAAFAWQGSRAATGYQQDIVFSGEAPYTSSDSAGPRISVRPVYFDEARNAPATVTDRIVTALPIQIEIELFDESGIDVIGVAPDEGLTIEIPGARTKSNINHQFQFAQGDFRSGVAVVNFQENDIKPGSYSMIVGAQDLLGYISCRTIAFEVVADAPLRLGQVFNYPNPMIVGNSTRFYFYTSTATDQWSLEGDRVQATIKIYSLSGKLLRVLGSESGGARNGIAWDGRDQHGRLLGPNIYLYRVTARLIDNLREKHAESSIRKLVIRPPKRG